MEDGDPPFYWQPPTTVLCRRRRPSSSPLLNSPLAIIILPSLALLFLFFAFHSFNHRSRYNPPDFPHQIPNPIPHPKPIYSFSRRSWDSLSIVLIVAAIVGGVFARRNEGAHLPPATAPGNRNAKFVVLRNDYSNYCRMQNQFCLPTFQREQLRQHRWFQFAHNQRIYGFPPRSCGNCVRHREEQVAAAAGVEGGRGDRGEIEMKEIPVDTFVHQSSEDSARKDYPAPVSPSPPSVRPPKPKRVYQSVPRKEKVEKSAPLPPEPPLPAEPVEQVEKKLKHRKGNGTKELATTLASIYSHRKTKSKQRKSEKQDSHDLAERATQHHISQPPLPPPPSVFHNLYSKSSKDKQIHSLSSAPPPPSPISQPPPEPTISDSTPRRRTTTSTFTSRKPPLPARSTTCYDQIESSPPPFRIPEANPSVVRDGRFVRIRNAQTRRAGSPESGEEVDLKTTTNKHASRPSDEAEMNGGDGSGPSPAFCCPSPDVNEKADRFIARHHDGWRLEKLNSWREKRGANVGLGPGPWSDDGPCLGPM